MKKTIVFIGMIVLFSSCTKVSYTTVIDCVAPNWTNDNKVEFFKVERIWKDTKTFYSEKTEIVSEKSWLCEINNDGSGYKEIGLVFDDVYQFLNSSSSAGEWVVFDNITEIDEVHNSYSAGEIWIIKRDGAGLEKVGDGIYPDFSPDAEKIVYEKPNQGIWIMNRDGSNDHYIVPDGEKYLCPEWAPEDDRIALYKVRDTIIIINASGNEEKSYYLYRAGKPHWRSSDTIAVVFGLQDSTALISLSDDSLLVLSELLKTANCSPDGKWFIGYDENGYFIIKRDGTNKWYLKDKIGGEK